MQRPSGQANLGFSPIGNLSTTVAAITQIEALIRRGELRPGDRMPPERELAELLGVSRPTVREALRALSILGIVRSRHGSGTYLGSLDEEALHEPLRWLLTLSLPAQDVNAVLEFRTVLESGLRGWPPNGSPTRHWGGCETCSPSWRRRSPTKRSSGPT